MNKNIIVKRRKVIQISTYLSSKQEFEGDESEYCSEMIALCDDGTLWKWDGCDWDLINGIPQYEVEE